MENGFDINRNIRKVLINHVDLISYFDFLTMISLFGLSFLFVSKNSPANTPCVFHVETTWKRPFPDRFNVEYVWCVCRELTAKRR